MIYEPASMAIIIFLLFVVGTVALSFYLGRRATSSEGYFAAHGQIPWFCLLYTSPSPRDRQKSRMPSSA